jgi:hypothetical protein
MLDTRTVHERCWDDIPWWVNGTLPESEQRTLAAHVEHCAECRDEVARHRELFAHLQHDAQPATTSNEAWQKLMSRIDAAEASEAQPSGRPKRRPWLLAVAFTQTALIVALAAALLWRAPTNEYVTLTSVESTAPQGALRVVFAPHASLEQVNGLLRQIDGEIVAGPSEAGVYTVHVARSAASASIATLRSHREVLFAEPAAESNAR